MTVLRMTDLDLRDKRVLIREDLNVPVEDGVISSDARIRAALPSLRAAVGAGARVIVMSHLGRPKEGEFSAEDSLAPVAARLGELLGQPVRLQHDWLDGVECAPGEVVLCENVRFNKGEKKDDEYVFFDSPWLALVKTSTMFVGELEFSDIPVDRVSCR